MDTQQSKAASQLYGDERNFGTQLQGMNPQVTNRFNGYQDPFSYGNEESAINQMYNQEQGDINRTAASDTANSNRGTASRLASQGITGGSVLNSAVNEGANNVSKNKYNALSNLKSTRLGLEPGLMENANNRQFAQTGAAQNVDFQNMNNLFQKYGMIAGNYGQQGNAINNLQKTNWFDDVLGVANTAAKFVKPYDLNPQK